MSKEPWNSSQVFIAGGKREWLSLRVSLFLIREEFFPQSSVKPPPQTSSHFTGQGWVTCFSLYLAEEKRDNTMSLNQL